jgi:disulfide oxidoreductase YuzD
MYTNKKGTKMQTSKKAATAKKVKNRVYSTTNYNQFKYLKGNRAITELHVRRLVEAIKEKDLQVPIIVDEKMNVVEGQHRLEAYKIVGRPILYIVKDNVTLDDVRKLNSVARKWTLTEYLMSHVKLGKQDYEILEWFHRTYKFGLTECIAMLNGKGYCAAKELIEFKGGGFTSKNLEQAKIWARNITKVGEYFQYYKKRSFVLAMIVLMQHSKFSWRTFEKRLINYSAKLNNQGSRNDFIVNLERLYNHNTSADKRIRLELYKN